MKRARALRLAALLVIALPVLAACSGAGARPAASATPGMPSVEPPAVTVPAVTVPAVTVPAVTVPAVTPIFATDVAPPSGTAQPTSLAATAIAPTSAPPSPTPLTRLSQLTSGGCCVQPFWSADSRQVRFIDKPGPDAPVGFYGVSAGAQDGNGTATLVSARLGIFSPGGDLLVYPENGQTVIERLADGATWVAPSGGRQIGFTPGGQQMTWQISSGTGNNNSTNEVWMANLDGTNARRVVTLRGGGISGWFPDGKRALVTGRESTSPDAAPYVAVLDLESGEQQRILDIPREPGTLAPPRLRSLQLSPEGGWVIYGITFSGDPLRDGLWMMRSDGSDRRRLELYGAYRWRAEGKLLLLPLEPGAASHRLVEIDAATGAEHALTDPEVMPFRIASGYWSLSPDGRMVAFVAEKDHNIWVIGLP